MFVVPSLYTICFDYIKTHSEELVSLEGVPYKPTVENLVKYLFTSNVALNSSILSIVSNSHSKVLREAQYAWTRIAFQSLSCSVYPRLRTLSEQFPNFITHLKMGATDLCDIDINLLTSLSNLRVLDLSENQNLSDRAVSYITIMALDTVGGRGLRNLEELYLENVIKITDKSLKYLAKLENLTQVNLTGTKVTPDVCKPYLLSKGFKLSTKPNIPYFNDRVCKINFKLHQYIELCSCRYHIPPDRKMHDYSIKRTSQVPLKFSRNISAYNSERKRKLALQAAQVQRPAKRPKASDFIAMIEKDYL